jgi:DNA-binding CsgD family transcriptional regulator
MSQRVHGSSLARAAEGLWELDDLAAFRVGLPAQLRQLVDCELASYNEIGPAPGDVFVAADPVGLQAFGGEYQLAFTVPAPGKLIGVTVSRGSRDFSDAELDLFEGLRGIVVSAYRNLYDRARLEVVLGGLELMDGGAHALLLVEASGALAPAHERAERLLRELSREASALETLHAWAHRQRQRLYARELITLSTARGELEARYVRGSPGNLDAIALRRLPRHDPQALRVLGLTRRQADVLHLVWQGQANAGIAATLDISEHTVRHHLEEIYRRLQVSSRAAAAQLAGRVLMGAGGFRAGAETLQWS